MLSMNDRMLKLATADTKTLARVDAVLTGEDTATAAFVNADTRTVTYTDAARHLACSRPTVYELTKAGRLDVVTFGGVNRITMKSIMEFASGKRPPDAMTVERMKANAERKRVTARINAGRKRTAKKKTRATTNRPKGLTQREAQYFQPKQQIPRHKEQSHNNADETK